MAAEFPTQGMELTTILVVSNLDRSKTFYRDILGATLCNEYGGTSCVFRFGQARFLIVTSGGPTKDKPDISFAPPADPNILSHSITIRVPDCQVAYDILKARGAKFITPPMYWEAEIRCFFRDPDGHLFEISQRA